MVTLCINIWTERTVLLSTQVVNKSVCNYCLFELSGEFWFFTNDLSDEDGHIRSKEGRKLLVPERGWLYVNQDIACTTVR